MWCALKYLHNPKQPIGEPTPYVIVTVLVDEVQFTQVTPKVSNLGELTITIIFLKTIEYLKVLKCLTMELIELFY